MTQAVQRQPAHHVVAQHRIPDYTTKSIWSGNNHHTLVIDCSDWRLAEARMEFLAGKYDVSRYCNILLPGGPGAIVTSAPSSNLERERILMLHGISHFRRVIAMAHEDCMYYKYNHPHKTSEERREIQYLELKLFGLEVLTLVPGAEVETFFAGPDESGRTAYYQVCA